MYGGRDVEINNRIGHALLSILPAQAENISAKGKVADDWAEVGFEFEDGNGKVGTFSFKDHPARVAGDISEALVELRRLMIEGGAAPWSRCVFTVTRGGKFSTHFDYGTQAAA